MIEMQFSEGEKKREFEMGQVIYFGEPEDSVKVTIMEGAGEE